jgi:hypothetical protein
MPEPGARSLKPRVASAWIAALAAAFAFRLAYGLTSPFWFEDERQIYLIGLRSFARGEWPYFGADIVWTQSRLPGALQGLLIGWPFQLWAAPEAPFILLNILSFCALALLARYLTRRAPEVPRWLVWTALLTLPWTLNYSTHILNTSYALPGAIVFFVGFFEAAPTFRTGLLPVPMAWAAMGLGLGFIPQFHMSWVLLPPYVAFAAIDTWRAGQWGLGRAGASFAAGAMVTGGFVVPTLLSAGSEAGGIGRTIAFTWQGPDALLTIAARLLSFTAFETNRFLGLSTADRLLFLWRQPWSVPFTLLVTLVGLVQPLVMAVAWFTRGDGSPMWRQARWLTGVTLIWIYGTFFWSVRGPLAHAYLIVFPVAAFYGVACWRALVVGRPRARFCTRLAAATLAAGVLMHLALVQDRFTEQSLYRNRALVQAAIDQRNDRFLGDRRSSREDVTDPRPRPSDGVDPDAYMAADPVADLDVFVQHWTPLLGARVSQFALRVQNRGVPAYTEIRYAATYTGVDGTVLAVRENTIRDILQPGVHDVEATDGLVPDGATAASIRILSAQKCVPMR